MGKRGIGQRRTVLQLDDAGGRNTPTYGFGYRAPTQQKEGSGLSGLMNSYVDSDDDEEEGPMSEENGVSSTEQLHQVREPRPQQKFVASTELFKPSSNVPDTQPTVPKPPPPTVPAVAEKSKSKENGSGKNKDDKPVDEVDAKVKDFLAEIGALDEEGAEEKRDELPATPPSLTGAEGSDSEHSAASEEEQPTEPPPTQPTEPTTKWQHCLDDGTQCYYYWNTSTNAVTWEIPPDYSQYLLQYKEYEEKVGKYEKEKEAWQQRQKERPKKEKKKKKKIKTTSNTETKSSLVSYPVPPSPSKQNGAESQINNSESSVSPAPKELSGPLPEKSEMPVSVQSIKPKIPKFLSDSLEFETSAPIGPQVPLNVSDKSQPQEEESALSSREEATPTVQTEDKDSDTQDNGWDMDIDDIDAELDLALERKTLPMPIPNPVLQKLPSEPASQPPAPPEDEAAEAEDTTRKREDTPEEKPAVKETSAEKRRAPDTEADNITTSASTPSKKARIDGPGLNAPMTPPEATSTTDEEDQGAKRKKAKELQGLVLDKLEFLEISRKGLSKLQTLLVEIQTRLEDWQCGELPTHYMLTKLHEAHSQLEQYECSAVPPGWSCHWDRDFRRYFYCHETTGATQWDYPEPGDELQPKGPPVGSIMAMTRRGDPEDPGADISVKVQQDKPASVTGSDDCQLGTDIISSLLIPPPPPPPPASQTPPPAPPPAPLTPPPPPEPPAAPPSEPSPPAVSTYEPPPPGTDQPELLNRMPLVASYSYTDDEDDDESDSSSADDEPAVTPPAPTAPPPPPPPVPVPVPTVPMPILPEPMMVPMEPVCAPYLAPPPPPDSAPHMTKVPAHIMAPPVLSAPQPPSPEAPPPEPAQPLPQPPPSSSHPETPPPAPSSSPAQPQGKEKKKKKEKLSVVGTGRLSMKKKGVPSMVQKWQQVQKEVEKEVSKGKPDT